MGHIWPRLVVDAEEEYLVRRKLVRNAWWPKVLSAPIGKRLLVISPHPDDEAIGAGGLLLAHKGLSEIHIVCLTDGERGGALENPPLDPAIAQRCMAEARREELKRVAQLLGARSLEFCGLPDGGVTCNEDAIAKVRSVVRRISPDVVLLPWFLDNHPDHRAANALYARACHDLDCVVLGYEIWETLEANAIFDITQHLAAKLDLIRHYPTQLRTINYLDYASSLARVRAFQTPVNLKREGAVEGFLALPNVEYCQLAEALAKPRPQAPGS
jgi:LmbE family N-acetylglucosaminyl deacetylase